MREGFDNWDIDFEKVFPYYQPILSADRLVPTYSHEVLGRYIDENGEICSLGAYFSSPDVSDSEALAVDQIIRKKALQEFAAAGCPGRLFINIRLAWLLPYVDCPEKMPTILWAKQFAIPPEKIVIEITEEEFISKGNVFLNVINYYRSWGCSIALDDFGNGASNIDRLVQLRPDIVKIDMSYVHKSEKSHTYRMYLFALASFIESFGIEVLYEGIETKQQLNICLSSKGRFYQGFLLAKPGKHFVLESECECEFRDAFHYLFNTTQTKLEYSDKLCDMLDGSVISFVRENILQSDYTDDEMDMYVVKMCERIVCDLSGLSIRRMYISDTSGKQLTQNAEYEDNNIVLRNYRGSNWAWRSYFGQIISALGKGHVSCLSDTYRDFSTKEQVYTYACVCYDECGQVYYVFTDVTYKE